MAAQTIEIYPSSYENVNNGSVTNASNAYNSISSTAYATIKVKTTGGKGTVKFLFDTSIIPTDAKILNVSCKAKVQVFSQMGDYDADVSIRTEEGRKAEISIDRSTSPIITDDINLGKCTREELNSAEIRFQTSWNTTGGGEIRFYGATLTVEYEVGSITGDVTVSGAQKEISGGVVTIGNTWKELSGGYINIGGTWKEMG